MNKSQLPAIQTEIRARQQVLRKLFMSFDVAQGAANLDRVITQGLELLKAKQEKPPTTEPPK